MPASSLSSYLSAVSGGFSGLLFFFSSSPAADDDTLRFFLSRFFAFVFLSSGSLSELELLDDEEEELELAVDELLPESELELEELVDGVRFFLLPATNTSATN